MVKNMTDQTALPMNMAPPSSKQASADLKSAFTSSVSDV